MADKGKSTTTTRPASSAPATAPMPWAPWKLRLAMGLYSYVIGTLLGDVAALALEQGRRRGALLEGVHYRAAGVFLLDDGADDDPSPMSGYFCSGTHSPVCRLALEGERVDCRAGCQLTHPTVVDLDKPETD